MIRDLIGNSTTLSNECRQTSGRRAMQRMPRNLTRWMFLVTLTFVGCTTPQHIRIESDPKDAHVYVNDEYVGKSPCRYKIENLDLVDTLEIRARIRGKEHDRTVVRKKPDGHFPDSYMLILEERERVTPVVRPEFSKRDGVIIVK